MLSDFTAFDAGVLIIIGLSTLFAFGKGFASMVLSLVAWAGAFFASIFGFQIVKPYGRDLISPPELADIISLVALFFVTLVILKAAASLVGGKIKDSPIGILDRSLGALFGLIRGMIFISVAYLAFTKFTSDDNQPVWIKDAKLRPLAAWSSEIVEGFAERLLGDDPHNTGTQYIKKVKRAAGNQFISEELEKQAAKYKDKARSGLDGLLDIVVEEEQKNAPTPDNKNR